MNNIEFKIQRYELYPPDESDCFVIGFKIIDLSNNNRTGYVETTVPLTDCSGKTSNEICQIAYDKIKNQIDIIVNDLLCIRGYLTNYTFIPNA